MFEIKRYQHERLAYLMCDMETENHLNEMFINGISYSIARSGSTGWLDEDTDREGLLKWTFYEILKIGWCSNDGMWSPYELNHPDKIYCINEIRAMFGDEHIFELHTERWAQYIEKAIGFVNDESMGCIWEWYDDVEEWPEDVKAAQEILEGGKSSADKIVAWFFR